jgi:hypothetical protein
MKKPMKHRNYFRKIRFSRLLLPAVFLAAAYLPCLSQINIDVAGSWAYSIPATNIADAGLDFTGTYTSGANQVLLSIYNSGGNNYRYRVDVRRSDISWKSKIKVWGRRTGDGIPSNGGARVWGGQSYKKITKSNKVFFQGKKDSSDIPIQYQLRNISVLIPAKSYSTTIIYTVTVL